MKRKLTLTLATILLVLNSTTALAAQISDEPRLTNGEPVTDENVLELLQEIEQDWPTGTVWGTRRTPDTHKNEVPSTESGQIMQSYRVNNTTGRVWHVTVALESPDEKNSFRFTDGNIGETIRWSDAESPYSNVDNLECYGENKAYRMEVWTRYPENAPYAEGNAGG